MQRGPKPRWIPKDSREVRREGVDAVVYCYEFPNGKRAAVGYHGKAGNHDFHYSFADDHRRQVWLEEYFRRMASHAATMTERKAGRDAFEHDLQVGDILYTSWGYDQTNVDFFQVVARTAKTVTIRPIGTGDQTETGHMMPTRDCFLEGKHESFMHGKQQRVCRVAPGNTIRRESYAHAWKWDGFPKYATPSWAPGH